MDAVEFRNATPPAARGSKLARFLPDLQLLREDGYTLAQLCTFLASNDVTTSRSNVSAYLARSLALPAPRASAQLIAPTSALVVPSPELRTATTSPNANAQPPHAPGLTDIPIGAPTATLPSAQPRASDSPTPAAAPSGVFSEIARNKPDLVALRKLGKAFHATLQADKPKK